MHTLAIVSSSSMKNSYLFSLCFVRQLLVLCFMSLYYNQEATTSAPRDSAFLYGLVSRGKCVFSLLEYFNFTSRKQVFDPLGFFRFAHLESKRQSAI